VSIDPTKVRPRRDWALVLCDKRQQVLASGIILTAEETGAEKVTETAGTIIRLGPSEHKVRALGLSEGQHVVFRGYLKYANPIPHDEVWEDGTPKEYFLMDFADIFAIAEGVSVGVFSGRPTVPERR
jgi:co-chaperonin GroES (HSP10)